MKKWSAIRHKLEHEYLAESLRGHITYYAVSYSKSPDHEGRAAIYYDDKQIIGGCYWNQWFKADQFPRDEKYEERINHEMAFMDDTALQLGIFDQKCIYEAFREFDNQSIEKSLESENLLVRIFAILDRRVGKRRLLAMKNTINNQPETFRTFYAIRMASENLTAD